MLINFLLVCVATAAARPTYEAGRSSQISYTDGAGRRSCLELLDSPAAAGARVALRSCRESDSSNDQFLNNDDLADQWMLAAPEGKAGKIRHWLDHDLCLQSVRPNETLRLASCKGENLHWVRYAKFYIFGALSLSL